VSPAFTTYLPPEKEAAVAVSVGVCDGVLVSTAMA